MSDIDFGYYDAVSGAAMRRDDIKIESVIVAFVKVRSVTALASHVAVYLYLAIIPTQTRHSSGARFILRSAVLLTGTSLRPCSPLPPLVETSQVMIRRPCPIIVCGYTQSTGYLSA